MQQTSKYQLNLIEGTDDFLPDPLNENMEKLEEALNQEAELREGVAETLTALAANVGTAGKTARIAWGSYTGTGTYGASAPTVFSCDFYPVLLVAEWENYEYGHPLVLLNGVTVMPTVFGSYHAVSVAWTSRQVSIYSTTAADVQFNMEGATYHYMILGYDDN